MARAVVASMAITLCLFGSAVAAPHSGADTTDSFLLALDSMSPRMASTLRTLGKEFEAKCGVGPTLPQYRALAESRAFYILMLKRAPTSSQDAPRPAGYAEGLDADLASALDDFPCS